jgi:simple sugar transport system ATP-binding protein
MPVRFALDDITKRYGSVTALDGAHLLLEGGEVHAVLGENGAGKTTLMRVAFGLTAPDLGTVALDGVPVAIPNPRAARALGIGMVHQHFTSVPQLPVAENVALSAGWPARPGDMRRRLALLCQTLDLPLDPDALAGTLPVALKQRLEILKALATDTKVLLLDEPTAVLTPREAAGLFTFLRSFASEGGAVALITHKLNEVLDGADRVTVLRAGRVTHTGPAEGETRSTLTRHMIGRDITSPEQSRSVSGGDVLVRVADGVLASPSFQGSGLRSGSLEVRAGEVVGIAAVEGNGQRELLRASAGVWTLDGGVVELAGSCAFIPEDRTSEGLIPAMSLTENVVLGGAPGASWLRHAGPLTTIDWQAAAEASAKIIEEYGVVAPGPESPVATLSGGNQQKLVLGRALLSEPRVIVAENPTRGLDVAAATEIHDRLRRAAHNGAAVLFYSSDLDEVLEMADRVVVVANGRTVPVDGAPGRTRVGELMLGSRSPGS